MRKIRENIKIRYSSVNNSVEALILFNERHQGLLELHGNSWWGNFSMGRKGGLCYVALLLSQSRLSLPSYWVFWRVILPFHGIKLSTVKKLELKRTLVNQNLHYLEPG